MSEFSAVVLGRPTSNWYPDETLDSYLQDQLARVFHTGQAKDREEVVSLEEDQAEPFSEYYSYEPAVVLVDGSWDIDARYRSGRLTLATPAAGSSGLPLMRAAVMEVTDEKGRVLAEGPAEWRRAFHGREIRGKWRRVERPMMEDNAEAMFDRAARAGIRAHEQHINGWRLSVLGVLFPEETSHWRHGSGWVFACQVTAWGRPPTRALRHTQRAGGLE